MFIHAITYPWPILTISEYVSVGSTLVQISFSFLRISVSVGGVLETRRLGGDGWVGLGAAVVDLDDEGTGGTFGDGFAIMHAYQYPMWDEKDAIDLRVLGSES